MPLLSHDLPPLSVAGNRIADAGTGEPVLLRGVNRSGLEYSSPEGAGSLQNAGITEAEWDQIVTVWKANVIRIPFNQDWASERPGYDAEPYLAALDAVIEMSARRGAYTILDLEWLDATTPRGRNSNGSINFVPALPDAISLQLWRQLASRYRDEPAVLFDILNEPHEPLPDDRTPLWTIDASGTLAPLPRRRVTLAEWQPWAVQLALAIRSQHPDALLLVSGLNWGYDLSSYPIADLDNVVYSTHVYPNKGRRWDRSFGDLAERFPVFVGEWGGSDGDLAWGHSLLQYMSDHQLGWAAWSWCDHPRLIEPASSYQPTRFGSLVQEALQSLSEPITTS
jgi:endoglucanase